MIGAGFAGLSAAVRLAARGAAVTLLEQGAAPGGKAGEWRAGGYRFDTGPSVLTLADVIHDTFRAAGHACPVAFAPLEHLCRYVYPSGRVWDVYADRERTLEGLRAPEQDAYLRTLARARELFEAAAPVFVRGPAPGPGRLLGYALRHGLRAAPGKRLPDLLEALGVRGDLRAFFLRFATYVGADPRRAPAVLLNVAWAELGLGVSYPQGGMHAVVRSLSELAAALGVETRYGHRAERLITRGRRVREVVTDQGVLPCDAVVAAGDVAHTWALLGRRPRREREPSLSGLVWLAGVRGREPRLAHHTVLFPHAYGEEFDAIAAGRYPLDPTLYCNLTVRADPRDAPPGQENWFVMANAPALADVGGRGGDPPAAAGRETLLRTLERRGFGPVGGVEVERWLTPTEFAALGARGSLYGPAPHGLLGALRAGNGVRGVTNLALASGTVHPGGGVPLAVLSGAHAASLLTRRLGLASEARLPA